MNQLVPRPSPQRQLRVLVIDDRHDTTDGLVRMVSHWGYAAQAADSGPAAVHLASCQHADVVLMDMEMPNMDGCQVARQLRRVFSRDDCFIIAATDKRDDESRQQRIEAGIDLMLIKPVDPSIVETLLLLECGRLGRLQRTPVPNGVRICNDVISAGQFASRSQDSRPLLEVQ